MHKNVHFRKNVVEESRIAVGKAEGRGMVFMQIEISPELELADCGDKLFQISEPSAAPWLAAINQIKLRLKTVLIMQTSGEPRAGPQPADTLIQTRTGYRKIHSIPHLLFLSHTFIYLKYLFMLFPKIFLLVTFILFFNSFIMLRLGLNSKIHC